MVRAWILRPIAGSGTRLNTPSTPRQHPGNCFPTEPVKRLRWDWPPPRGEAAGVYWWAKATMLLTWTLMPGSDPTKPASPKANTPPSDPTIQ